MNISYIIEADNINLNKFIFANTYYVKAILDTSGVEQITHIKTSGITCHLLKRRRKLLTFKVIMLPLISSSVQLIPDIHLESIRQRISVQHGTRRSDLATNKLHHTRSSIYTKQTLGTNFPAAHHSIFTYPKTATSLLHISTVITLLAKFAFKQ